MVIEIDKVDVWAGTIEDRPGGLARILDALTDAGANLEFLISRRAPEKTGSGVVFLAPLSGTAQTEAANEVGLSRATNLYSLRIEGPDQPRLGANITRAIADAGINMRGLSAASFGRRCVMYLAFDSDADATKAREVLKQI